MKEVKFDGYLDDTLGKIRRLTLETYPHATMEEVERHAFSALLDILQLSGITSPYTTHAD